MHPPASNKTPRSFLRLPSYPLGKPTERLLAELSGAAAGWRVPQRSPSARYPRPTSTKPPLTPCICLTTMSRSQGARPGRETHENSQGASVICNNQTVVRARKALTGEICPIHACRRTTALRNPRARVVGEPWARCDLAKSNALPFPTTPNKERNTTLPVSTSRLEHTQHAQHPRRTRLPRPRIAAAHRQRPCLETGAAQQHR